MGYASRAPASECKGGRERALDDVTAMGKTGKAQNEQMFSGLPRKWTSDRSHG